MNDKTPYRRPALHLEEALCSALRALWKQLIPVDPHLCSHPIQSCPNDLGWFCGLLSELWECGRSNTVSFPDEVTGNLQFLLGPLECALLEV